jgi:hypothetical protein
LRRQNLEARQAERMNINLEIDDVLGAQIESAARARGLSARAYIRETLRAAVSAPGAQAAQPFVQKVHDFGADFETAWTRLAEMESEEYVKRAGRK